MAGGLITGALIGKFAASIAPVYFTFLVGVGYCFLDILKLDYVPAISVIIQYVCLPALLFLRLATNDPSQLDLKLLGADALSKFVPLVILLLWWRFISKRGKIESLEWVITFWMLATLPNTVLIGDQILTPMFTVPVENQTTTIIFAQSLYWYNVVIVMMEIREMFIEEEQAKAIPDGHVIPIPEVLPEEIAEAEKQDKSRPSSAWDPHRPSSLAWDPHRSSAVWELHRMSSAREPNRPSSAYEPNRPSSAYEPNRPSSAYEPNRPSSAWEPDRPSSASFWEPNRPSVSWEPQRMSVNLGHRPSWEMGYPSWSKAPYDPELHDFSIPFSLGSMTPSSMTPRSIQTPSQIMMTPGRISTATNRVTPTGRLLVLERDHSIRSMTGSNLDRNQSIRSMASMTPSKLDIHDSISISKGLAPDQQTVPRDEIIVTPTTPSNFFLFGRTLMKVVKRMLQVPLFYGSALGFIWSINRWRVPSFMKNSVFYCATMTVALAMILVGMVCVKNIKGARGWIPCGWKLLWAGFIVRFLFGPIIMYVCTLPFNIKGTVLRYAILQVIVPQGSMTFALAQIYGCKLSVITPAIYVQMIVFVPIILAYYAVLQKIIP